MPAKIELQDSITEYVHRRTSATYKYGRFRNPETFYVNGHPIMLCDYWILGLNEHIKDERHWKSTDR